MKRLFGVLIISIIAIYVLSIPSGLTFFAKSENTISSSIGKVTKTATETFSTNVNTLQSKLHISSASESEEHDEH